MVPAFNSRKVRQDTTVNDTIDGANDTHQFTCMLDMPMLCVGRLHGYQCCHPRFVAYLWFKVLQKDFGRIRYLFRPLQ